MPKVVDLTKIAELLQKKEKEIAEHKEYPRMYLYLSQERRNQRFSFYFFDGVSKVNISKERFAEAGIEACWLIAKIGGNAGAKGKSEEVYCL